MKEGYRHAVNLISELKYALVFAALLVCLPLTAFSGFPLHGLLGGLFIGLGGWHLFFAVLAFFAVAWSLMLATGLLVDCIEHRRGDGYLSRKARDFFGVPVSRGQFVLFSGLGALATAVVVLHAPRGLAELHYVAGAVLIAYLGMILLCTPARLADPAFEPLPRARLAGWVWRKLDGTLLARLFGRVRSLVSWVLHFLFIRFALEYEEVDGSRRPRLLSDRFFALTNFVGLVTIILCVGKFFFPPDGREHFPPAASFLYALLALALWILLSLDCQLARLRLSPLVAIVVVMLVVWRLGSTDHHYPVQAMSLGATSAPLTPTEVAAANGTRNIVVVASAGGGILASGWTALVLNQLIEERPELAREIRLLSTISGGSVGAAHYTASLKAARAAGGDAQDALAGLYARSVHSSLAESAYGFAMLDFWRLFSGSWIPVIRDWDRGLLQDDAWCRGASPGATCTAKYPLSELREPIRSGALPAVIFGATVMETGRRVMITPLDFETESYLEREDRSSFYRERAALDAARAPTLSEYLLDAKRDFADLSLWTAARLSATFAYVSPAASADVEGGSASAGPRVGHHLIDGGYYENFGVTSALDWMHEVLEAKAAGRLDFDRLLLVRLNAFRFSDPLEQSPQKGSVSALLGPVLGLAAIRSGVATTRNEFELMRFIRNWNDRLGEEVVAQVEFRPGGDEVDEPLSWHLTERQQREQLCRWPVDPCTDPGEIGATWRAMLAHLGDDRRCEAVPASPSKEQLLLPEARGLCADGTVPAERISP